MRLRDRMARWAGVLAAVMTTGAAAAEIEVLSAGAVEPGLRAAVARFERQSGHVVRLSFAAAPAPRERSGNRESARAAGYDLLIAPVAVLQAAMAAGTAQPASHVLGGVGIGVAVRPGAPVPAIDSPQALKASLLAAESVVYNRASTGVIVERLLRDLGLEEALAARTTRVADGAAVMNHLLRGRGHEIGLGAITEIRLHRDQGLVFVGPLPPPLQRQTIYAAALGPGPRDAAAAQALWHYLGSAEGLAHFRAAGID